MNDVVLMAGFLAVLVWAVGVGLVVIGLGLAFVRTVLEQIKSLTTKNTKSHERGLSGSEQRAAFLQGLEKGNLGKIIKGQNHGSD